MFCAHDERGGTLAAGIDVSDQFEYEWRRWLKHRAVRIEQGDDLRVERQVDHTLYFRRRWHAFRALKIIRQTRTVRLLRTNGCPRWILETSCLEDLEDDSVRHSLQLMLAIAQYCHGTYEGFGAPVVS